MLLKTGITLTVVALSLSLRASGDEWLTDPATECSVWNPKPSPQETIAWVGSKESKNANGYGVAIWSIRGEQSQRAEGSWKDGKLHGYATWTCKNGTRYQGQWKSGLRHGYGIYEWPDGTRFAGYYDNGRRAEGRIFKPDHTPAKLTASKADLDAVYKAQDAAILARKASTRASMDWLRANDEGQTTELIDSEPDDSSDTKDKPEDK